MDILSKIVGGTLDGIGPFFLLLGLLIFIHEWGHFIVARMCGVRVETFSIGFGKKIFNWQWGDTNYCVSLIPLGGYVKMYGDDPTAEYPEEDREVAFLLKPVSQRIAIVLAGPLMNLIFAMFLFSWIGAIGEPVAGPQLGNIKKGTPAYEAGFRAGDNIISVDGTKYATWKEIKTHIESRPNQEVLFEVTRERDTKIEEIRAETILKDNPFIFTTQTEIGWIEGLTTESRAAILAVTGGDAADAGLRTFDVVTKIGENKVHNWRDLTYFLEQELAATNGEATLTVENYKEEEIKARTVKFVTANEPDTKLADFGIGQPDLVLYHVRATSPAGKAGMKPGDLLTSINGEPLTKWETLLNTVKNFDEKEGPLAFGIIREGKNLEIRVAPELTEIPTAQGGMDKRYAIGISPTILGAGNETVLSQVTGPWNLFVHGIEKSYDWSELILISMVRLVQGEVSAKNIGGVISIGRVASQSYDMGLIAFLKMMAIISINLFILNLLPVPVLDGGHLVFFGIEAIKGSPLSLKKMEIAQQVGLVLLLTLMVFALFNDITHLISAW